MATKTDDLTMEQVHEFIAAEHATRSAACSEAISQALQTYQMELRAIPQLTPDGRISAVVQLVPARD